MVNLSHSQLACLSKFYEAFSFNGVYRYYKKYKWYIMFVLLASMADVLSTIACMMKDGPSVESHIAIRIVSIWFGPVVGPIFGKLCQLLPLFILTFYFQWIAKPLFIVVIITYIFASWVNIGGCYTRGTSPII